MGEGLGGLPVVLHDRVVVVGCVQVQSVHFVECVRQTCEDNQNQSGTPTEGHSYLPGVKCHTAHSYNK